MIHLCRTFLLVATGLSQSGAGELKIDINRDTKNNDQYTEAGFLKWSSGSYDGATTASETTKITKTFISKSGENLTISFAQSALSQKRGGKGLGATYDASAVKGEAKLLGDGLTILPANLATGGQIEMTIRGLDAGSHSLLTYHNSADRFPPQSLGPIDILLNGKRVISDCSQTIQERNSKKAATSYLQFSVSGPTDVTSILFSSTTSSGNFAIRNPIINGFELDTPNIREVCSTPFPPHQDWHVDADAGRISLRWSPPLLRETQSYDLYLGIDEEALDQATRDCPEFLSNQVESTRIVPINKKFATYFWRVDRVSSEGRRTKGIIWSFSPRLISFPGAEGYGRFARGGRGGKVVKITSLQDYDADEAPVPGSLRYAIEEILGPRTLIFDISGLITLKRRLTLSDNQVTIAGQTAPAKGICLRGHPLGLSGSDDSIVRFIRNRPGDLSGLTIDGGGLAGCNHSIMDHCSMSWSIDEAFSSRNAGNITLQKTLISEALNIAGHKNYPKGTAHGYAATVGGNICSLHHNLLAHCEGRNWSLGGGLDAKGHFDGKIDIRNNVVYNWGKRTTDGGAHQVNFVNNYYKPGAASTIFTALNPTYDNFPGTQQYYMSGNVMPGYFDETNQPAGRTVAGSNGGSIPQDYPVWVKHPFFASHVTTQKATEAYHHVLNDVGCSLPIQDLHDRRIIQETVNGSFSLTGQGPYGGKPGLPNSQRESGGWEDYPIQRRSSNWDTNQDGLPNWWEILHGFDPNSSLEDSQAQRDLDNDGYTALEDYLHWLARPHFFTKPAEQVSIDLSNLLIGYPRPAKLQVTSTSHGIAELSENHRLIFQPPPAFQGLVEITVKISSATIEASRKIGIAVTDSTH